MKEEVADSTSTPGDNSTTIATPQSEVETNGTTTVAESVPVIDAEDQTSSSPTPSTAKGKDKDSEPTQAPSATKEAASTPNAPSSNLVGKINNLISTDLGNITEGRDFLWGVILAPIQIAICILFLWEVLSWA